jgi:hypothetical protein
MLRKCKTCGRDSVYKNGNEKCPYCKVNEIETKIREIKKGFKANYFCKNCRLRFSCYEPCKGKEALLKLSKVY